MGLITDSFAFLREKFPKAASWLPNEDSSRSDERGVRTTPENELKAMFQLMWVDPDLRQSILDVRQMDREDGRVKRIHSRIARDVIKGGLVMQQAEENETIAQLWRDFGRRLQLTRVEKLKSDARGLVMEGNLPLQIVLADASAGAPDILHAVRMPSETMKPNTNSAGRFIDLQRAYLQLDVMTNAERAAFPLWKLFMCRFDPDNFDDLGSLGRPFLDSNRSCWQKLKMTDEDLVIRRRVRAPLRLSHILEGASPENLEKYRAEVEKDQNEITTDYYANKKGGVTAVQGDANLDHMKDIVYLLDSFFAGTPLPKGMMGFTDNMARDILEDLKRDYYDEIDVIQDTLGYAYEAVFRFQLLLKGINPDAEDFCISFAERRTETLNQTADRALKMQAIGYPQGMLFEAMGDSAAYVRKRQEWERENVDPYPDPTNIVPIGNARVKVTPGNARKGESGTTITNR